MSLLTSPRLRATNQDGSAVSFAIAVFSMTGTTTPVAVYDTADFSHPIGSTVQADVNGEFPAIYLNPANGEVRLRITSQAGDLVNPQWDIDPVGNLLEGETIPAGTVLANLTGAEGPALPATLAALTDNLRYASEADQGAIKIATNDEALAGVEATHAITPSTLQAALDAVASGVVLTPGVEGSVTFGAGVNTFIVKWGRVGPIAVNDLADITFPVPFPAACWGVSHSPLIEDAYDLHDDSWSLGGGVPSNTGYVVYCASAANAKAIYVQWLAWGN